MSAGYPGLSPPSSGTPPSRCSAWSQDLGQGRTTPQVVAQQAAPVSQEAAAAARSLRLGRAMPSAHGGCHAARRMHVREPPRGFRVSPEEWRGRGPALRDDPLYAFVLWPCTHPARTRLHTLGLPDARYPSRPAGEQNARVESEHAAEMAHLRNMSESGRFAAIADPELTSMEDVKKIVGSAVASILAILTGAPPMRAPAPPFLVPPAPCSACACRPCR